MTKRPEIEEYNQYFSPYVNLVPDGDIITILEDQAVKTITLLKGLTDKQALFRYAPDKWTIKEVIGHISDTERIMSYRLLCIARGETAAMPGYDDMEYVKNAGFNNLSLPELLENLAGIRKSTIQLLRSLPEEAWARRGNANHSEVTVRALAYIMSGHERHHRQILNERYMDSDAFRSI